ncbi:hypothetical protein MMC17_010215 [Xylographa soralifera]|nr:hypothetical protein [Xylographa soralifera]
MDEIDADSGPPYGYTGRPALEPMTIYMDEIEPEVTTAIRHSSTASSWSESIPSSMNWPIDSPSCRSVRQTSQKWMDTDPWKMKKKPNEESEEYQNTGSKAAKYSNKCALPDKKSDFRRMLIGTRRSSWPLQPPSSANSIYPSQKRRRSSISFPNEQSEDKGSSYGRANTSSDHLVSKDVSAPTASDIVDKTMLLEQSKADFNNASEFSLTSHSAVPAHGTAHQSIVSHLAIKYQSFLLVPNYLKEICTNGMILMGLSEPQVESPKVRIRWRCKCGKKLYDDYEELRPGGLAEIEELLKRQGGIQIASGCERNNANSGSSYWTTLHLKGRNLVNRLWTRRSVSSLPTCQPVEGAGSHPSQKSYEPAEQLFLLMCVNHSAWACKLIQENASGIASDQQFFRIIRAAHQAGRRNFLSWFRLQKLKSIRSVQFEVFKNYLVAITKVPDYPPPAHIREYKPCYHSTNPPVGENLLTHYYHHPHDADDALVWFHRIPKKLRQRVVIDSEQRAALGWGMYFVEGFDWTKYWILSILVLLVSSLVGICYSVLADDVQSGFAVASFLMTLFTCLTGTLQSSIFLRKS